MPRWCNTSQLVSGVTALCFRLLPNKVCITWLYLFIGQGDADIFFPTDFRLLEQIDHHCSGFSKEQKNPGAFKPVKKRRSIIVSSDTCACWISYAVHFAPAFSLLCVSLTNSGILICVSSCTFSLIQQLSWRSSAYRWRRGPKMVIIRFLTISRTRSSISVFLPITGNSLSLEPCESSPRAFFQCLARKRRFSLCYFLHKANSNGGFYFDISKRAR